MPTLYIVRGLPGSGKTTLAHKLAPVVFEADDFFKTRSFDASRLKDAHANCFRNAMIAMRAREPKIAVANTFIERWESHPYVMLARANAYKVEIHEPTTPWAQHPFECARRCTHNVPRDTVVSMYKRKESHSSWL